MKSLNLSSYTPELLMEVLTLLKSYVTASKQIWNRALLVDPKDKKSSQVRVEFSPGSDESFIETFTQKILLSFFPESKKDDCVYIQNSKITGGIRIFLGDDMVDISYEKFAHLIKNA